MRRFPGALLLLAATGPVACADEIPPPESAATVAADPLGGLPPPMYVSSTSAPCTDDDVTGCEVRCADGEAEACSRLRAAYAPPATPQVQVATPGNVVQFLGPVGTVNITQKR